MKKIQTFLISGYGKTFEVIIMITIFFTNIFFPILYDEISGPLTILFMLVLILAIGCMILCQEEKKSYVFLAICAILSIIFANKLYFYSNLLQVFPWLKRFMNATSFVIIVAGVTLVFSLIKIYQKGEEEQKKDRKVKINSEQLKTQNETLQRNQNNIGSTGTCKEKQGVQGEKVQGNKETNIEFTETDNNSNNYSMQRGSFFYILSVVMILLIILGISLVLIWKVNGISLGDLEADPIEKATTLFSYGALIVIVFFIVGIGLLALLIFSKYLLQKIFGLVEELKSPPESGKADPQIPIYVMSVLIVAFVFYLVYKFGRLSIDDFTDFAFEANYLAYPLLFILGIAVFILLLWIVHMMLGLISTIKGESLKSKFSNLEKRIKFNENVKRIIEETFKFLFSIIFSVLSFLSFIPSYFMAMAKLIGVPVIQIGDDKAEEVSGEEGEKKNDK